MSRLTSHQEIKSYLIRHPMHLCWYGPRATDVDNMQVFFTLDGTISCYGSNTSEIHVPSLSYETKTIRKKYSIDDLADYYIGNGQLEDFVKKNTITAILPYDSDRSLEDFCHRNHIAFYSRPDQLKDWFRDKTNIDVISKEVGVPTIPGIPCFIDTCDFTPLAREFGLPLFLHFVGGAGGSGNYIVYTEKEFEDIKHAQAGRRLNVKKYIVGRSCCMDICVTSTGVFCGPLEEMLIGAEPIQMNPTEYVGSSWFPGSYSQEVRERAYEIGMRLGMFLQSRGFIGAFHPDFLMTEDTVFLTELNMRFGGSVGAYAKIQQALGQIPLPVLHAMAFRDSTLEFDFTEMNKQNLYPVEYGLIILKNNTGKPITIPKTFTNGLYTLGERLTQEPGMDFTHLKSAEQVFIVGLPESEQDVVIDPGAFICEAITRFPVSNFYSNLNDKGKELAYNIFSHFVQRPSF